MSGTMFLRSCASVFRQCVKASPRPLLSRTIHTSRLNRSSDKMENGVDYSKGVTIVLEKSDGSTLEEIVNRKETLYDVVKRVDPMGKVFLGFGQCGGCTDCATCHVFLEERYSKLQPLKDEEDDILVGVPEYSEKFSRLGCCVHITEEMDGMVVKFPSILGDFCELEQSNQS